MRPEIFKSSLIVHQMTSGLMLTPRAEAAFFRPVTTDSMAFVVLKTLGYPGGQLTNGISRLRLIRGD